MPVLIQELPEEETPHRVAYDEFENDAGDYTVPEDELDEEDAQFVHEMILTILVFIEDFVGFPLYPYQREIAYRIIESVILNDGEEISVLCSRQSGKTETLAQTIAGLMILLPRLAVAYPKLLGKFSRGFWVGVFAPSEEQAETVWSRVLGYLTAERAVQFLVDPEIDDRVGKTGGKAKTVALKKSGSLCRMQTCNPRAKIESKSYHFVLIDECQDADEFTVIKSIEPMMAAYNGTIVKTGTCNRTKGHFYKVCKRNERRATHRGARRNHFEFNYKTVIKFNPQYKKFIDRAKARIGEDSDEFQLSFACKWLIDQGMFTTDEALEGLGDNRMQLVGTWWKTPVVVGVDPARTKDSTVVTVVWVDWDYPDAFGYYEHRILNWLEITNKEWEEQYYEMYDFLSHYNILRIGVDVTGMGSAVADRLKRLFPDVEVVECSSDSKNQSERWKHLKTLIERRALVIPWHSKARRVRCHRRFLQQMSDLETKYQGKYMLAEAPGEKDAHDDYPDSLAIACAMTLDEVIPEVEEFSDPFHQTRTRR
jgi:hypothetical protein